MNHETGNVYWQEYYGAAPGYCDQCYRPFTDENPLWDSLESVCKECYKPVRERFPFTY